TGEEAAKSDAVDVPWGAKIRNRHIRFGQKSLTWQPCLSLLQGADLVIVEQASRHLLNYVLLVCQAFGVHKVAFWGHGRNLKESAASPLGEYLKSITSRHVHWWF